MNKIIEKLKNFNQNNKGVTLVELIIAVVVLSISIGPLLYTFVFTTRFNASSKIRQRSTSASQTVMENLKAADIKDVYNMFNGIAPGGGTAPDFLRNNTATYSFTSAGDSSHVELGTYTITGMTLRDTSTEDTAKYDAVIEIDKGLVTAEMPDVPVYDPNQDALWQEVVDVPGRAGYGLGSTYFDPYYVATSAVKDKITSVGYSFDDVNKIEISRTMNLSLTTDSASVNYVYNYTITMNDGSTKVGVISYPNEDICGSITKLRNVYYYYYPAYADSHVTPGSSVSVRVTSDTLNVTNATPGVNIFVYKQINSLVDGTKLRSCENSYRLKCISTGSSNGFDIYDCIQANLKDIKDNNYKTTPVVMIEKGICPQESLVNVSTKVGPVTSGIMTYNVNVKVYKHNDHSKILSEMSGTVLKK